MQLYALRRLVLSFFLALGASLIVFFSIHLAPATPCWRHSARRG